MWVQIPPGAFRGRSLEAIVFFCGKMIGSNNKLTDKINDREVYMKEIDHSYYYEGYSIYKAEDL